MPFNFKASDYLKLAQSKVTPLKSGYSPETQPDYVDEKTAMDEAKKDVINILERANCAFYLHDNNFEEAIALAENLEVAGGDGPAPSPVVELRAVA